MPFMVIYRTSDGSSRFEQLGAIDEAALFVERLRNKDSIDHIRIYRMEEIGFAFKPYYKVELGNASDRERGGPPAVEMVAVTVDDLVSDPVEVPVDVTVEVASDGVATAAPTIDAPTMAPPPPPPPRDQVPAAANGRQGLFGR